MQSKITAIVLHHLNENDKYLHWCLTALKASVGVDLEILCYSSAQVCPEVPEGIFLKHDPINGVTGGEKFNAGIKAMRPDSKYVLFMADDVMVSKYAVQMLANALGDNQLILGPASNCDSTTRYWTQYQLHNLKGQTYNVPIKCTLEDIAGFEQSVIDFNPDRSIIIRAHSGWISFYCVMIPKTVVDLVGPIDERLHVRWDDVQYCLRASKKGIASLINLGAWVLHFGDRTIARCATQEQYAEADKAYHEWSLPIPEDSGDTL